MRSVRLHGAGDVRLQDEPVPTLTANESLVRVSAVGICGSDLHWLAKGTIGDARITHPLILGHEFSGIVETGETGGQLVAVDPLVNCEVCEPCRQGNPNLCLNQRFAGHGSQDGALREFIAWPSRCLVHLPNTLSDEEAAMLEPLGVAIHSVDLAHMRPGMTAAVFGCGPIGLLIIQVARIAGAYQVIATEKLQHRLDAARSFGADVVLDANGEEAKEITSLTSERGVDVAIEAAGEQAAVDAAIAAVKPGGCVILAGIPGDNRTAFDASIARRKGLTIKLVRRMKHTYPRAIHLVERGQVDVRSLITHRFPLEGAKAAFSAAQRREGIKVIIKIEG
jgi:L-iditol 2-dehydrogenase